MGGLPLVFGSNIRHHGHFPEFVAQNVILERAPSNQEAGTALLSRAGLATYAAPGPGPNRAVLRQEGVLDGDVFNISGENIYRINSSAISTTLTGTIPGNHPLIMAAGRLETGGEEFRVADGENMYVSDGLTVATESFPGSGKASSVDYLRGHWFGIDPESGEIFVRYITDAGWDELTFTDAEYKADKAEHVTHLGDQVVVMGKDSVELFGLSGDPDAPLTPYGAGLLTDIGCKTRFSVARLPGALFMVGSNNSVYQLTPQPTVISKPDLAAALRESAVNTFRAWAYTLDGHPLYVLTTELGTWCYDVTSQEWTTNKSHGYDFWRAGIGVQVGEDILAADISPGSGQLWRIDPEAHSDAGEPIARICTGWLEIKEQRVEIHNLVLNVIVGHVERDEEALVSVRCSRDGGETWSFWREASLGVTGQYSRVVRINRWGRFRAPGALFQIRCTSHADFRITNCRVNV